MKFSRSKALLAVIASAAVAMTTLIAAPAANAGGLNRPAYTYPVNMWSNGQGANNTTGLYTVPGDETSVNISYQGSVAFGSVAVGDVLKLKLTLKKVSDNSLLDIRSSGNGSYDLWIPTQPSTPGGGLSVIGKEVVYSHTVTQQDITDGVFTNFNTSSIIKNGQYTPNYQYFNIWLSLSEQTDVQVVSLWTKNNNTLTPSSQNFFLNVNYQITNADEGWDMSEQALTYFRGNSNQWNGSNINSYGCIDTSELALNDVISLNYSLKVNGSPLTPFTPSWQQPGTGKINMSGNWSIQFGQGGMQQGQEGGTWGQLTNLTNLTTSVGTLTFPALAQKHLDGAVSPSGAKTKLLGFGVNLYQADLKPGNYVVNLTATTPNHPGNLLVSCKANDVVNLTAVKTANGVDVTFKEPGTGTYDVAGWHYCMLRLKKTKNSVNQQRDWLGGIVATEVTPATSPKSFKCSITGMQQNVAYEVALFNGLLPYGSYGDLQTTWLNVVSSPDVSTDATAVSVGIGTSTNDIIFDPATTTYNVTSTDATTPYPSVVTGNSQSTVVVKLGGTVVAKPNNLALKTGANVVTVEVTSPSGAKKIYTFNITKVNTASDATLKSLSFGQNTLTPEFSSSTTSYSANVGSTVTTYPFPSVETSQANSTVVVKQGGSVVTGPGALNLVDGANVVTVEVTAPDGTTKKTYTMTINKAAAAKDATLTGLPTIDGVSSSPSFDANVTSYSSTVSESTTSVNLSAGATKTVDGATVTYKLNGLVVTPPAELKLRPGANKLETIVTSSDGTVTKTYTQTITRTPLTAGSSSDANDARLADSTVPGVSYVAADGQTVTGFDPEVTQYTKDVPVNQTSVSVLGGGTANSGATKVVEYSTDGGQTWLTVTAPGSVPLAAGKTTKIRTTVTSGSGSKVYITDVNRPAEDPTAEVGPTEGDGDTPPKGITGTKGKFVATNDTTFQISWDKATGKLGSQATGIYTGYIEAKITFSKAGKNYTCTAVFGTTKALPAKTAAQKTAAMKMKTFTGKQFCIDKLKMNPKTTSPVGGFTTANFKKIAPMNKTAAELTQEKAALAALKGFSGEVAIQVIRYRAWPSTMVNLGNWDSKGGKISVQIRNTRVTLN